MAILKVREARKLSEKEILSKIEELRKELLKLNSQVSSGATPENPGKISEIKRTIARLMFIKNREVKNK